MIEPTTLVIGGLALGIVILIGLILGSKVRFNMGMFGISIDNSRRIRKFINMSADITNTYVKQRSILESNILKNQMTYSESVLKELCAALNLDGTVYELLHSKTKAKMKENGFESLGAAEFSQYIGSCIDSYRILFKEYSNDGYLDCPDFADKIASIFNHAFTCASHWKTRIKDLDDQYKKDMNDLTKGKSQ